VINQPTTATKPFSILLLTQLRAVAISRALHPLTLLLLTFFCTTLLWACIVEPGRAPDEWDHLDYIRYLAATQTLPVYGQTARFNNPDVLNSETQQPPLYYLLATPFYLLGGPALAAQVVAVRLLSALLGTVAVAFTYALGRAVAPKRRAFALALAAIVGFNPMFMFMNAAVSNDALINALYPGLLLFLAMLLKQRSIHWKWLLALGALLGVGLLSKFSIVGGVLASGIVLIILAWRQPDRRIRTLLIYGCWTAGGLLLIAGWYLARNWLLYGDPSGVLIMASYHVNPMRPYASVGSFWQMLTTRRSGFVDFWPGLLHGFWGIFDFYIIWMAPRLYGCLDALLVGGLAGSGIWAARVWSRRTRQAAQERLTLAIAGCVITLITLGLVINYSYRIDHQPQGRYLLPALIPIALAIVTGWEQLLRPIKIERLAAPLLIILILSANMLALFTALAPNYHNLYLKLLAAQPEAPVQYVAGAFAASAGFVAEQSQIQQLEVLLNRPASVSGPIIWRLHQPGVAANIVTAVEPKPLKGLGRYIISVPQPLNAGATYILSIQAPLTTEDQRLTAYLPPDPSVSDLNLQVVYPPHYGWATLRRIDYTLRSAATNWPRGKAQRLLYACALPLMLALAARAFDPILRRRWSWLAGFAALALMLALLWAPPQMVGDAIPTHTLTAMPEPSGV
jgi:4-amino-4-deoxy-L-arabinose transferase-like glycosyltransferase